MRGIILTAATLGAMGMALASAGFAAMKSEVAGLRRLTEREYRNSIADIFGADIAVQGSFEPGTRIEPGSDCLHGSTRHFSNAGYIRSALAQQPWRSADEIAAITAPEGVDTVKEYLLTRFFVWNRAVAYRGFRKGIETYVNPFAAPDPGEPEVTGKIADGFDLDGNFRTGGFTSPDGQCGIDNALYRAWGCDAPWRGDGNATLDLRANDKMQEGLYTMVIRISGSQDPMNDSDAVVEIGFSPDHIVKDAGGGVASDYSFRIARSAQYTRLKAAIKNGVVETEQAAELHTPRIAWFYDQTGDTDFRNGRIRLAISADGRLSGLIGGYRDWRELYVENTFAQDGGQQGIREHEDAIALYYALKRNADYLDPKTRERSRISCAYRIKAVPAFVVDPDKPVGITVLAAEEPRKQAFEAIGAAFVRATTQKTIEEVPSGTTEAAPNLDKKGDIYILNLPNGAYLQKILDRPAANVEADETPKQPPPPAHNKRADNAAPASGGTR